jgi:hypothetical protein
MKRNVILAVVAIAALALAGMGGLFADFSDIEISEDNTFSTGSLDLAVSDYTGTEWNGGIIPWFFQQSDAWPGCSKDRCIDLHNYGQGTQTQPWLYLHLKNFECYWVYPKVVYEWIDCDPDTGKCIIVDDPPPGPGGEPWTEGDTGTGLPKPVTEPEYVAECGGIAGEDEDGDKVIVPGVGCCFGDGDGCELAEHIDVIILTAGPYAHDRYEKCSDVPAGDWVALNLTEYDKNHDGVVKLNEIECEQIELGQLPNCNMMWLDVTLRLQDIDEDDLIAEGVLLDPGTGYGWFDQTKPAEAKWDHWPTNALMKDGIEFDMSFELLQNRVV